MTAEPVLSPENRREVTAETEQHREPAIAVSGLRKVYGATVALHDLTLTVQPGEIFGFLGPNGAGKTTAVKLITGLAHPTSGEGSVLGRPLGSREG
ncbi:MAG: transporter related protein, partial [Chloroflexi bacterium]|nr:transporter related protein [Chloroflexota bacterium]